jgi:hypothetical protein
METGLRGWDCRLSLAWPVSRHPNCNDTPIQKPRQKILRTARFHANLIAAAAGTVTIIRCVRAKARSYTKEGFGMAHLFLFHSGEISTRLRPLFQVGVLFLAAVPPNLLAQEYPSKAMTVIVPFPAGGPSDVVARIVTEQMSKRLGQSMVIENVGGGGGTIGSARVAAAPPDGYTLLAGSMGSHVAAPVLTPNTKYDSERDFVPIGLTANAPAVVVARKDFPAKDLRAFVDYLKANGDRVKQAHGGVGASSHMACLLFTSKAGG